MPTDQREQIEAFCWALGWPKPRRFSHPHPERAGDIVWYESVVGQATLQFNVHTYPHCMVRALKYGIVAKFRRVQLGETRESAIEEACRFLRYWSSHWFESAEARRRYRLINPEYAGWTWSRYRREAVWEDDCA